MISLLGIATALREVFSCDLNFLGVRDVRCRESDLWRLLTPEGFSSGRRGGTLSSKVDRVMPVCQRKLVVGTLSGEN